MHFSRNGQFKPIDGMETGRWRRKSNVSSFGNMKPGAAPETLAGLKGHRAGSWNFVTRNPWGSREAAT